MIDEKTITQIAHLARLTVTPEEIAQHIPQLQKILTHFSELSTLDTEGVEPLITPIEITEHLRADEVKKNISTEELMALAPDRSGMLFKVPPVI